MAVIEVKCRYCEQETVVKNGREPNGLQRFHCQACRRYFQVEYRYNGHKPGTAQRIERHNLTLRRHIKGLARRTIGFSKSVELHEKVIGPYIDKFHYQSL